MFFGGISWAADFRRPESMWFHQIWSVVASIVFPKFGNSLFGKIRPKIPV